MNQPGSVEFLLVAYNNLRDVQTFIEHVRRTEASPAVHFSVCDNGALAQHTTLEDRPDTILVRQPDNPGYLTGGLVALEAATRMHGGLPDWAILSNTDLVFESKNLLDVLGEHDPQRPLVLAPRITEGPARIEKNPHLSRPRSPRRHRLNHLLTHTPLLAYGYLVLSRLKLELRLRRSAGVATTAAPAGATMYAPYGAMIVFSRGFLERGAIPRDVPITAEEYVVAESARREGAPVLFEPRIHVHHAAHTTTGPKVSWRRALRLSRAFAYIDDDARAASP